MADVVIRTRDLIETSRQEIIRVRQQIEIARATVQHSLMLLARSPADAPSIPRKSTKAL